MRQVMAWILTSQKPRDTVLIAAIIPLCASKTGQCGIISLYVRSWDHILWPQDLELSNSIFARISCLGGLKIQNESRKLTVIKKRTWNKGKLIGQKSPLTPQQVWAIRVRLQLANHKRELALFNLALDSKLRGCDLVSLRSLMYKPEMREDLALKSFKRRRVSLFNLKSWNKHEMR